jgi:hypothetical protein
MDASPGAADALDVEGFDVVWFSEGEEVRHPLLRAAGGGGRAVARVRLRWQ